MKYIAFTVLAALAATLPVAAEEACTPVDAATRVLASANPNDLHPDWTGENRIGTSWSLFVKGEAIDPVDDSVTYLEGVLVDPRGNEAGTVFVVQREWNCA